MFHVVVDVGAAECAVVANPVAADVGTGDDPVDLGGDADLAAVTVARRYGVDLGGDPVVVDGDGG